MIPTEKTEIRKIFVSYVHNLFVYVLTAYGYTFKGSWGGGLNLQIIPPAFTYPAGLFLRAPPPLNRQEEVLFKDDI